MDSRWKKLWDIPGVQIVVGVIALITLVAFLNVGMQDALKPQPTPAGPTFEQQTGRPDPGSRPDVAARYVDELALRSGGDWNRLEEADQKYVNSLTAGHGAIFLRDRARYLKEQKKKAAPAPSPGAKQTPAANGR